MAQSEPPFVAAAMHLVSGLTPELRHATSRGSRTHLRGAARWRPRPTNRDRHAARTADRWLDAWVLEATGRGLPKDGAYWQAGWDWIVEERAARRPGW